MGEPELKKMFLAMAKPAGFISKFPQRCLTLLQKRLYETLYVDEQITKINSQVIKACFIYVSMC